MNLISESKLESIIENSNLEVTDDVKKLIVAAINSIDEREMADAVSEQFMREMRRKGFKF